MLMEESFFLQGMNNVYNSIKFAIAKSCLNSELLTRWEQFFNI